MIVSMPVDFFFFHLIFCLGYNFYVGKGVVKLREIKLSKQWCIKLMVYVVNFMRGNRYLYYISYG